jgi:hypothetical protein
MTKKITISVPDDVAEFLEQQDNVSGYLTSLARWHQRRELGLRQLREAGFDVTAEGMDQMRAKLAVARAKVAARDAARRGAA